MSVICMTVLTIESLSVYNIDWKKFAGIPRSSKAVVSTDEQ